MIMIMNKIPEVCLHKFGMGSVRIEHLLNEALVGGFGEPALFIKQSHDTHGLLNQLDRRLQIQAEVDELPFDA